VKVIIQNHRGAGYKWLHWELEALTGTIEAITAIRAFQKSCIVLLEI